MNSNREVITVLKNSMTDVIPTVERSIRQMKDIVLYGDSSEDGVSFAPTSDMLTRAEDVAERLMLVIDAMDDESAVKILIAAKILNIAVKTSLLDAVVTERRDDVLAMSWMASLIESREDEEAEETEEEFIPEDDEEEEESAPEDDEEESASEDEEEATKEFGNLVIKPDAEDSQEPDENVANTTHVTDYVEKTAVTKTAVVPDKTTNVVQEAMSNRKPD
jgi:hypothetical protein